MEARPGGGGFTVARPAVDTGLLAEAAAPTGTPVINEDGPPPAATPLLADEVFALLVTEERATTSTPFASCFLSINSVVGRSKLPVQRTGKEDFSTPRLFLRAVA